jgi:tellurite resistance protein
MSTIETELILSAGIRERHGLPGTPRQFFDVFARALKILAAADGEVHPAEMDAYLDTLRLFGADEVMIATYRDFDPASTTIAEVFQGIDTSIIPGRGLLYDAIRIAQADGDYSGEESAAVLDAARILGIDAETVGIIVALAEAEAALKRLHTALLIPAALRAHM